MNIYHIWFDAKPGVRDMELAHAVQSYLDHLKDKGSIEGWRLTRRKLGLGNPAIGEWHVAIEVVDLAQLDLAFSHAARRTGEVEIKHHGINALATNITFGLYRDFPDPIRQTGEEKF